MGTKSESAQHTLTLLFYSVSFAGSRKVVCTALQEAEHPHQRRSGDRAGELITLDRTDAAIGISPNVAQGKARTAALLQSPQKNSKAL